MLLLEKIYKLKTTVKCCTFKTTLFLKPIRRRNIFVLKHDLCFKKTLFITQSEFQFLLSLNFRNIETRQLIWEWSNKSKNQFLVNQQFCSCPK